ncbi:MAG: peptidase family protein [Bryobacterales bacterium]|nr:peptidase family protein [Bryobacterales bacterium]
MAADYRTSHQKQLHSFSIPTVLLLVPVFLFTFSIHARAVAAQMNFGNILPGGSLVSKAVVSMREGRYVDLIQQQTDFSCGAAAVATILNYAYGKNLSETEVIEGMLAIADEELVKTQGFSLLDIKRYAETLGMRGRGYEVASDTLDKIKIPVIALLDIRGYKHFVVLKKTEGERVFLGDPALGNRLMSKEEFIKGWNGIVFALIGQGFLANTVLINPPAPLTARGLRSVHATRLTDTQLLEFGFTHADLF